MLLRAYGAIVEDTGDWGRGFPDIVVGFRGKNWLFEIKPNSRKKLNARQRTWHDKWKGQVNVITTFDQAIREITR